ncbi:MAG: 4Fe-4S binding protein [Chloroflexi bacterium]|nr:4Fe-4S binding protein [Chloroflexota bacterium]
MKRPTARLANAAYVPWRRARQAVQIIALAMFLGLLVVTRGGTYPDVPPSLFFRLDPLAWLTSLIADRQWIGTMAWALATVALTVLAGRVWCGWLCPLGTTLDGVQPPRRWWRHRTQPDERWRLVKYLMLIAMLGAAVAGNLTLMIFDPISLLTRALASFGLPALNQILLATERALYAVEPLQPTIDAVDAARAPWFPTAAFNPWGVLAFSLLVAIVALNWLSPRFWCRYLCPLGGLIGLISRIAIVRRVVAQESCKVCLRCSRECPTGTIDSEGSYLSDPAECIVCLDCIPVCPVAGGQQFAPVRGIAPAQGYDPQRRQALGTIGLAFAGAVAYPLLPDALRRSPYLIRPPGAQTSAFLGACIRCSECVKVCPTSGLQPSIWEAGLDGVWTPTLAPRTGYCDYSCNACGQVCPTGAIPPLALEVKRTQVIGRAEIDRERCLPWAKNSPCIVCEEMCPLAPKAVELETVTVTDAAGLRIELQRPSVIRDKCIGCGICETKCPVDGTAAIRVSGV